MTAPSSTLEEQFVRLQRLLLEPHVSTLRQHHDVLHRQLSELEDGLARLSHQIYDPAALTQILRPVIGTLLSTGVTESRDIFAAIVAELIDVALTAKIAEDRAGMAAALAPIIPDSIAYSSRMEPEAMGRSLAPNLSLALKASIEQDRGAIAQAIAPEMGAALKEQIRLEREAIVDALYPVIGNTISRYFAELLQEINDKLEQTLSVETFTRKLRARLQGISEAELLLRDATPVRVQAAFLIHKTSGLIIAEAQPQGSPLESDMIAGMLTAIRSFVSEYVSQSDSTPDELHDIEYGDSQIWLESAGYCYLAVVVQGQPSKVFFNGLKGILAQLIADHGSLIQNFEGDLSTIPTAVPQQLQHLIESAARVPKGRPTAAKASPTPLKAIAWVLVLVLGGLGIWGYLHYRSAWLTTTLNEQLRQDPALALYRLEVHRDRAQIILKGYVPTDDLAQRAADLITSAAPTLPLDNQVVVISAPTQSPIKILGQVQRTAILLNQIEGISLTAQLQENAVKVDSAVRDLRQVQIIDQAFRDIPGVQTVRHTTRVQ